MRNFAFSPDRLEQSEYSCTSFDAIATVCVGGGCHPRPIWGGVNGGANVAGGAEGVRLRKEIVAGDSLIPACCALCPPSVNSHTCSPNAYVMGTTKGGVVALSSGDDWGDSPGAMAIFENSTFMSNRALADNGGVVNMGEFTTVNISGHENVFAFNECEGDGAVLAATRSTRVTVEGGVFYGNIADVSDNLLSTYFF